jgi:hypothetical protein
MTKEEFLKEHQNNEELIKELDEIIGVLKTCDDQIPYFAIHMKQLGQDLYSYHEDTVITKRHKDLLSILVDIGIVDKFPSRHKDETSTYKIKTSHKFSKTLLEQLNNWKNEQQQKSQPNIVENYTNSIVNKDSEIHKSDLRLDNNSGNKTTNAPTAIPNQNEDSKIIDIIKKYWWFIIIPISIGIILLKIEYGWFNNK